MSDHHERARLIREDRSAQEQVLVSDEAAHIEQRAERMEEIEVYIYIL